ncbi:hypothetical protein Z043_106453 [Scleropages formosus]|uniref:Protoheme IX farnesyltransferase, mitochondrial n=1 Tax=Scleropages formosus TaxID=113540 RepID=A0A0P7V0B3_SCLFO|nr:hypothetical protein Z043_106453 [Scleropages formosus]
MTGRSVAAQLRHSEPGLACAALFRKLTENASRGQPWCDSLAQLCKRYPADHFTFQHFSFLKRQYVTKGRTELLQQAKPKSKLEPVSVPLEERDDAVVRHVQEFPAIRRPAQPAKQGQTLGGGEERGREAELEAESVQEARLEKQWKELKVEPGDLPGVYARLSKIKLTALVVTTAAAGYAMAPVPFDPSCFLLTSLGTGLSSFAANSINQDMRRDGGGEGTGHAAMPWEAMVIFELRETNPNTAPSVNMRAGPITAHGV